MVERRTQPGSVQDGDEKRSEAVSENTASEPRNRQRSNELGSTDGAASSASGQVGAVRGSVNTYEIAVLYHPDLEIDLEKAENRVTKIIADNGGTVTKTDNWGKRKLAYPIKGQDFAVYVFYTVEVPAENLAKVEQTFNITDEIVRFMITKPDLKAMAKAEALKTEKAQKAASRSSNEDEDNEEE